MKSMDNEEIRLSILRYLCENPQAEDNLDAIVLWWLMKDRYALRKLQVGNITRQLVSEGLLLEKSGLRYAVNPERLEDIFDIVNNPVKG